MRSYVLSSLLKCVCSRHKFHKVRWDVKHSACALGHDTQMCVQNVRVSAANSVLSSSRNSRSNSALFMEGRRRMRTGGTITKTVHYAWTFLRHMHYFASSSLRTIPYFRISQNSKIAMHSCTKCVLLVWQAYDSHVLHAYPYWYGRHMSGDRYVFEAFFGKRRRFCGECRAVDKLRIPPCFTWSRLCRDQKFN